MNAVVTTLPNQGLGRHDFRSLGDTTVTLAVGGKLHRGWEVVDIRRSIENFAGEFSVQLTDRWQPGDISRKIERDAPVNVDIGGGGLDPLRFGGEGHRVLTGYVDDVEVDYDDRTHTIRVTGRDKTGDLVDCSAIHQPGSWTNAKLERIVRDLVKPFGIEVDVRVDTGKAIPKFAIQPGETVHAAIERLVKQKGLLAYADGLGGLIIGRAGQERAGVTIVLGKQIEKGSGRFSNAERYSDYIIKGQTGFNKAGSAGKAVNPKAVVKDPEIKRYRPLLILNEDAGDGVSLRERAEWEKNVRKSKSQRVTYTLPGWRQTPAGAVWNPNLLVRVQDPYLHVETDLLVAAVQLTKDERGTITRLEMTGPNAFDKLPEKGSGKGKGKSARKSPELW